jgi:hypothetical protein
VIFKILSSLFLVWAAHWDQHQESIQLIEKEMYKLEKELDILVQRKKNSYDQVRVHETLERIVSIHAELIDLRHQMDMLKTHLEQEHPEKAHVLKHYDSELIKSQANQKHFSSSELTEELDQLLIKVKLKYASFFDPDKQKRGLAEVDQIVKDKKKEKRNRDAETYLRERSDIKLSK